MGLGSGSRFTVLAVAIAFLIGLLTSSSLGQQQPKVMAPHKPVSLRVEKPIKWLTPAKERTMVGGLWMTGPDLTSSIYLRNVVETDAVTVKPILYLSNGRKYALPKVVLEPAGVTIVSINDALQKEGVSRFAMLGGYVELQYTWPWDPFCATIRNVDTAHSLIFTYALRPTMPPALHLLEPLPTATNAVEGMWWKHEPNVTAFVTLANLASHPTKVSVEVTDNQGQAIAQHNLTVSPHGMKLVNLRELEGLGSTEGGIRIVSSETTDMLVVNGGLKDQAVGYSAMIPFQSEMVVSKPVEMSIAELGLMAGAADPMMQFPAGTSFTPYSFLRNVSGKFISVKSTIWWMEGNFPHSAALSPISLQANETRSLDVMSLFSEFGPKNFNGSFNLVFDVDGKPGSLVMTSGSVDQTNNYVFEVVPRSVGESVSKSLQYWSTGNGDDTMVTLWNPTDEAQDFVYTLFFSGGHYEFPIHLDARMTRAFNISEIIQNQLPDAKGETIPLTIHEGGGKLAGSHGENEHIMIGVESGIYNVRKATCSNSCQTCNGFTQASIFENQFTLAVDGTHQLSFLGTVNTGGQYDMSNNSNWSSNNPNMATVTTGLVTAMDIGSTIISDFGPLEPLGVGYVCTGNMGCPMGGFSGSSGGTITGPDHLQVLADRTDVLQCAATTGTVRRAFTYVMDDQTGAPILNLVYMRENVPATTSSCDGSIIQDGFACFQNTAVAPGRIGEFLDLLAPGCPGAGVVPPCGFTFANQQWQWCRGSGSPTSMGTVGPVNAQNTLINVNGNVLGIPPGTIIPK